MEMKTETEIMKYKEQLKQRRNCDFYIHLERRLKI